jgi:hypothetical protein
MSNCEYWDKCPVKIPICPIVDKNSHADICMFIDCPSDCIERLINKKLAIPNLEEIWHKMNNKFPTEDLVIWEIITAYLLYMMNEEQESEQTKFLMETASKSIMQQLVNECYRDNDNNFASLYLTVANLMTGENANDKQTADD